MGKHRVYEIAKELGAKVYQNEWLGFGPQKNRAVELAKNDVELAEEKLNQVGK